MISDTPRVQTREEAGQERATFCGRPLWMTPYHMLANTVPFQGRNLFGSIS